MQAADPALHTSIQQDFTTFDTELKAYEVGDGLQPYDQTYDGDRNQLKATLAALSEHLAQMPAALKIEVK